MPQDAGHELLNGLQAGKKLSGQLVTREMTPSFKQLPEYTCATKKRLLVLFLCCAFGLVLLQCIFTESLSLNHRKAS